MSYRKEKKEWTKLLKVATTIQDAHPLSGSAANQVRFCLNSLSRLKRAKKRFKK